MKSPVMPTSVTNNYRLLTTGIALTPFYLGPSIVPATTDPVDLTTFGNASSLILNSTNGRIWVEDDPSLDVPPNVVSSCYASLWREIWNNDCAIVTKSTNVALSAANTNYVISYNGTTYNTMTGSMVNQGVANIDITTGYTNGCYFSAPTDGIYYMSATITHAALSTVNNFLISFWVNGNFYQGGISRFDSYNQVKTVSVTMLAYLNAGDAVQVVGNFSGPASLNLAATAAANTWSIKRFTQVHSET